MTTSWADDVGRFDRLPNNTQDPEIGWRFALAIGSTNSLDPSLHTHTHTHIGPHTVHR